MSAQTLRAMSQEAATREIRIRDAAPYLLVALSAMLDRYVGLVNSGDAGFWNPEEEAEVIAARAAIAKAEGRE